MQSIVSTMIETAEKSANNLSKEIDNVKYGPIKGKYQSIIFTFRGEKYLGYLKDRNKNYLLGFGKEADQAIAFRVLVDGHAEEVEKNPCVDAIWV